MYYVDVSCVHCRIYKYILCFSALICRIVLWGSALFFAILLFDIAGDQIGWYAALRVWLIMILMPVLFFLISPRVRNYIVLNTPPWAKRLCAYCFDVTGIDAMLHWCREQSASYRTPTIIEEDMSRSSVSSNVPTTSSYRSKRNFSKFFTRLFRKRSPASTSGSHDPSSGTPTPTAPVVHINNPINKDLDMDAHHLSMNEL